jgi:cytochrome oxidase Cu insertion factor (SCO1/SenC/PrrC family)
LSAAVPVRAAAWLLCLSASAAPMRAAPHDAHDEAGQSAPAPGYGDLGFAAPPAGTYSLPSLGAAADGAVLEGSGEPRRLHDLLAGKTVLLGFIYTHCSDINGCPLATWVLGRVQARIRAHPLLKDRVRLLSLSFDPARDTPAVMDEYGSRFRDAGFDWRFLTTTGSTELRPLLDAYGQWTMPERNADGLVTGNVAHLLRVYLIDEERNIRNIYNANFLHPDILVNDLITVVGPEK